MKPIVDGNDEIGESEPDWSTARLAGSVFKVPSRRRRPGCFLFKGNHQTIWHLSFMGKQHKTSRHPYVTTFQYFSCIELMKSWFLGPRTARFTKIGWTCLHEVPPAMRPELGAGPSGSTRWIGQGLWENAVAPEFDMKNSPEFECKLLKSFKEHEIHRIHRIHSI